MCFLRVAPAIFNTLLIGSFEQISVDVWVSLLLVSKIGRMETASFNNFPLSLIEQQPTDDQSTQYKG